VTFAERLGWVGSGGTRTVRVLGVLAAVGYSLALMAVADAAASSVTWAGGSTGRTESAAHWSTGANWVGGSAPTTSQALETLTFPHLTNGDCTSEPPTDTCYLTLNDLSGLSAESIQLDDANDYLLAGNEITLGKGGLTASAEASGSAGDFIELPLQLSEPQKWSIADRSGGAIEENGLFLGGNLTGSDALTAELSNGSALVLDNDTEVGPVTIEGPPATEENIDNGVVSLEEGELDSSDRQSVDLSHVFFEGTGAVGSLSTNHATLDLGNETGSAGGLEASNVELDSTSGVIFEITGGGSIAQTDYSQLVSRGPAELAGAIVVVVDKPSEKASCPVLVPGATYTFLSTTGKLSGTFSNAPEGGPEIPIGFVKACGEQSQTMRIGYNRSAATETVTGTVEAESKEKEEGTRKLSEELKSIAVAHAREEAEREWREKAEREGPHIATLNDNGGAPPKEPPSSGPGGVALAATSITVQSNGTALVKLNCLGIAGCHGKLTLTAKVTAKVKGRSRGDGKKASVGAISSGSAGFSIAGDETKTVRVALDAAGRALFKADHGHCNASLAILELAPNPKNTQTKTVRLVQANAHDKTRK
jgi:hypothetical protein